jgi:hypothetical protein
MAKDNGFWFYAMNHKKLFESLYRKKFHSMKNLSQVAGFHWTALSWDTYTRDTPCPCLALLSKYHLYLLFVGTYYLLV